MRAREPGRGRISSVSDMARFNRLEVLNRLVGDGILPIVYHHNADVVMRAIDGCVEGGARVFEFTNRGDDAIRVFEAIVARCRKEYPDLALGCGSIEDPETCALYISAGTNFVVSPLLNLDLLRLCNRRKIAHVPGCGSVTEVATAEEYGCELVKLFPANGLGGPQFVRALRGPRPWSSIIPTAGVEPTEENVRGWVEAGCPCLGMGSKLFDVRRLEAGHDPDLPVKVSSSLKWIRAARAELE